MVQRVVVLRKLRPVLWPVLGACLVGYFAFHTVQGNRGLIARSHLQAEVAEAEATLAELRRRRADLELRADLLHPERLDLDMLDERARVMLNLAHPDDIVVYWR